MYWNKYLNLTVRKIYEDTIWYWGKKWKCKNQFEIKKDFGSKLWKVSIIADIYLLSEAAMDRFWFLELVQMLNL